MKWRFFCYLRRFLNHFQLLILFALITGLTNIEYAQQKRYLPTQIGIIYNYPPDSLFIDGKSVPIPESGSKLDVGEGTHHIRALLDGCEPIEETITLKLHRLKYTYINFRLSQTITPQRLFTLPTREFPGKQSFAGKNALKFQSVFLSGIIAAGWFTIDRDIEMKDLLPGAIPAIAANFIWPLMRARRFAKPRGDYHAPEHRFRQFGLAFNTDWGVDRLADKKIERMVTYGFSRRFHKASMRLTTGPAISVAGRYYIKRDMIFSASTTVYPSATFNAQFEDTLLVGVAATRELRSSSFEEKTNHTLVQLQLSFEKDIFRILEQQWAVGIAGSISNSIEEENQFILQRFPAIQIADTANIAYKVNLTGFGTFFKITTPFNHHFAVISKITANFGEQKTIFEEKISGFRLNLTTSLQYQF